jgi:hypothetical protein
MLRRAVRGRLRGPARELLRPLLDLGEERRRTSPATKLGLRTLQHDYGRIAASGAPLPSVWDTGLRVFSELDEDGVILFLLAVGGPGTRRFVDIGAGDGLVASNTANLALNLGFRGLHVEGDPTLVRRGRGFYARHPDTTLWPPASVQAMVTPEGVDAVEAHPGYGLDDYVMPYTEGFDARAVPAGTRIGASAVAMTGLAGRLGYRLVGANVLGFNLFYARDDVALELPVVGVEQMLRRTGAL